MRYTCLFILSSFLISGISWQTDITKAKQLAISEHKNILLNFSGSDWCGPCIHLEKDIFENKAFSDYADGHLVLLNADFPRLKKHQLSDEQQKMNDQLADIYNKDGIFPLTLLLSPEGKVLKKWEGFPRVSADEFTNEVKSISNAGR
jgi:thioredoxin-related protein